MLETCTQCDDSVHDDMCVCVFVTHEVHMCIDICTSTEIVVSDNHLVTDFINHAEIHKGAQNIRPLPLRELY